MIDVRTAYKTKRRQHRGTIRTISSEALFYRPVLLPQIKTDLKTCHTEFSLYQSDMLTKAQTLKNLINKVRKDFKYNVFCDFDFKHRCLKQMIEMSRHIVSLQEYELRYVQPEFTFSALQFLSSIKKALPQIHLTLHTSQFSMTESLNKEDVMELLSAIQITETGNRRVGNQCLLKLTSGAEFHQSLTLTGVDRCYHISCVTSDWVWVNDGYNLILTDTTGVPLHRVEDSCCGFGLHTVNSESELIYIDRNYNINKLSKDMNTTTTFIERTNSTWRPRCVYWSPSTGDLLVAMYNDDTETGKVVRYNQSRQLTQTIQNNNAGQGLYREPNYITENNNGDVVVSDFINYGSGAVVVTERGGRHRFYYTGHPSRSKILPRGICTDALSHILVCDVRTKTVQMLDRDGQFLSHLLIRPSGIFSPHSLSYDVNTHRLWVGSEYNNTVVIYRYITRQDALTDLNPPTADVMESLSAIQTTGTEKPQQGNQCLLKLMSTPELLPSLTLTGVRRCYHISCVTSDRIWVSDDKDNLILTDATGVPLHRVEDSCRGVIFSNGLHTVNSESELIYIERNYNINKLSKDMKTTTTFIERTDSTWIPQCVYWSPSTGDLLVGMWNYDTVTAKVTRHNQSVQLTHTIQHDNTGLGLYRGPNYITENNNGDVVVSDYGAVVVTERGGRHRFSYTGHPSGSGLGPCGICTDALSHILVCDGITKTVQMLDRDGQFLSHLLIRPSGIFTPRSLSYDVNTHRLWVGSRDNNTVVIYRYITRQDALTDEHTPRPGGHALSNSTTAI
uniref:Tripartite motif-containing protein 3 n=1 Tax=Magallana gigas TaxID=29159 RepID=K1RIT4_MAGGI